MSCQKLSADNDNLPSRDMEMDLRDYPGAIANLQRRALKLDQRLRVLREHVAFCLATIERQVMFDASLKNEGQRKVRRTELTGSDEDYVQAVLQLRPVEDERAALEIEVQLLERQFSVLKLEQRGAIANMHRRADAAA